MTRLKHKKMKSKTIHKSTLSAWIMRIIIIIVLVALVWAQSGLIVTRNYTFKATDLPKSFVGYKIIHISDICNENKGLVKKVKKAEPDIILISGGYQNTNGKSNTSAKVVDKLCKIAPVYYVYSNNDTGTELNNTSATNIADGSIEISPESINAQDFIEKYYDKDILEQANNGDEQAIKYVEYIDKELKDSYGTTLRISGAGIYNESVDLVTKGFELSGSDANQLSILLNSNIEYINDLCKSDVDIVLSGGTYGVKSENSDYSKGIFGNHGATLFISGGIGGDIVRILNYPEIQLITLSDGTIENKNPLEKLLDNIVGDTGSIFDNDGGFREYTYSESLDKYVEEE